ncbi:MAG: peptide-methionine (S)-S-oxide reductase MsrA [Bacteriovorax sp.]|nr:peptide-methionine (S)-S-oxide reductase MsrA [Bacteriovorax sp.]
MITEKALLGAGCFWGVEHILKKVEGIVSTDVGYSGGDVIDPTYPMVCTGTTGHAEVVLVEFNPQIISYEHILDLFFRLHDPSTLNRQHNDIGTQYRSVIFYYNNEQKEIAKAQIAKINASKVFKDPVVTQVSLATTFYSAEDYHQDYLVKNPTGYMCHILRD